MAGGHESETPQTPMPIVRQVAESGVDAVWFYEWRRDVTSQFKELRREQSDANIRVESRLSGIEGRLSELEKERNERRLTVAVRRSSVMRKAGMAALISVVASGAVAVTGSTCAFIWWLAKAFMAAGSPGIRALGGD